MGNQESVPNNNYVVKKKVKSVPQQKQHQQHKVNTQKNIKPQYIDGRPQINHNYYIPQHQYVDKNNDYNTDYNTDYNNSNYRINNNNYNINDVNQKIIERENNNSAIMERNVLNDLYNRNNQGKQNNLFDYPTNSNNELSIPKPNFDNLEFTPYNFNENVNKFKKSINDEREEFEEHERNRRAQFDNSENKEKLYKTINICYQKKYKLSDVAKLIVDDISKVKILKSESNNNYSGNGDIINSLNLNLLGLEETLKIYRDKLNQ